MLEETLHNREISSENILEAAGVEKRKSARARNVFKQYPEILKLLKSKKRGVYILRIDKQKSKVSL